MSDIALAYKRKDALEASRRQAVGPDDFHAPQENGGHDDIPKEYSRAISEARRNPKSAVKNARNILSAASLWKYVEPISDLPFAAALGGAMLKDLLDLATFETVILPMIFSMLCSIFIFMMLLLAGAGGKRKTANKILQKILIIIGGGMVDGIPGLDFLPIETITVIIIYMLTLMERRDAEQG